MKFKISVLKLYKLSYIVCMTKYDGIEKPRAELTKSNTIKKPRAKKGKRGFFYGFLIRLTVAGVLLGAIFGIAQIDTPVTNTITDTIRNVIGTNFSQGGYISSRDDFLFDSLLNLGRE